MCCQSDRATRNDLIAHVTMPRIGSEPRNPSNLATPDKPEEGPEGGTDNDNHVQRSNEPKKILRAKDFSRCPSIHEMLTSGGVNEPLMIKDKHQYCGHDN
ncbi:GM14970 [Drosophila sechellia]|uniref:GM14970 n=1 Tax=Drosophila sechellia TaxID=7238 RepID=B4IFR1_DROSE|nr:GM14970 [Drosophila sechellia]